MKDIDYFYEKDLDRTNIKEFYESLPSHLQSSFAAANRTKITWGSVLQGYRGPANYCNNGSGDSEALESSYGVQEIKFWWGARKDLNSLIPVVGSIFFGIGRVVQNIQGQLEWSSLYFDKANGNLVSYAEAQQIKQKNKEAENHDRKGNELFEHGRYKEACEEFEHAYKKCSIGYSKENRFRSNRDKSKTELAKLQEKEKQEKERINKIEIYNSVLQDFSLMVTSGITDCELTELGKRLDMLMDSEYGNDSAIVNRFHIVSLRIERKKMNSQLELVKSINLENINDLKAAIMNLIETEIAVLKELNITDQKLEQELKLLEKELDDNVDEEGEYDNIESIAIRAERIHEEIQEELFEKLSQETLLEYGGNALRLRVPLIASTVETYLMNGMNEILQLRISSIEEENTKQIKILSSNIIDTKIGGKNLHDVADQLVSKTNENEIIIIPLLVTAQTINKESNINHWIGLISEHTVEGIIVSCIDSENSRLEGLNGYISEVIEAIRPKYKVSFRQIVVEQQRYNNCGFELIENIILYITGSRAEQETAVFLHSLLWEQSLILAEIKALQYKDMRSVLTTLPKKNTDNACNDGTFTTNCDDDVVRDVENLCHTTHQKF